MVIQLRAHVNPTIPWYLAAKSSAHKAEYLKRTGHKPSYDFYYYKLRYNRDPGSVDRGYCFVQNDPGQVTQLLAQLSRGDKTAEAKLLPLIYGELRRLAGSYLRGERPGHTLQPTALVHEAYLRLTELTEIDWQNSSHFFAIAARIMRRILIDHARAHVAEKRGGGCYVIEVGSASPEFGGRSDRLLALDEALERLSQLNQRHAKVVELKFFGGLTEDQAAITLGVSTRTVKRDWRLAKAWLYRELKM